MKTFKRIIHGAAVFSAATLPLTAFADPSKAKQLSEQAAYKIKTGDVSKVEMLYSQALQEDPINRDIPLSLAEFFIQQHRVDDAEKILVTSDKTYYRYWKVKGILHQVKNEKQLAITAFEQSIRLPNGTSDIYVLTYLQTYYESIGNSAAKKHMENLIGMARLSEPSS